MKNVKSKYYDTELIINQLKLCHKLLLNMDPNQTCDLLLSYLKKSNLNFSLSESPFAATIYLKKSFIVDKHGVSRTSGITEQPVSEVNIALKNIITGQQSEIVNYQHALHDLGMNLEKAKHELLEVLDEKVKYWCPKNL